MKLPIKSHVTIQDAKLIWQAGVDAVIPAPLIAKNVQCFTRNDGLVLKIANQEYSLGSQGRLFVIGMGKASASMAQGLEESCSSLLKSGRILGHVNIPEGNPGRTTAIELWPARAAGCNEPSVAGVEGSYKILQLLEQATCPDDLILCLVSGGGSALLPLPIPEITLDEKLYVTRFLSGAGANINELNTVRKQLSLVKGGGLRRLCSGRRLVSLILSDVPGDPLDIIASGCTVANATTARDALTILQNFHAESDKSLDHIIHVLTEKSQKKESDDSVDDREHKNIIIGSNKTAVQAAAAKARSLGYQPRTHSATVCEGQAEATGRALIKESRQIFDGSRPDHSLFWSDDDFDAVSLQDCDCIISGGEPVVELVPREFRGLGGRNTQLVLAALLESLTTPENCIPIFLSGGTDGEDGPTESAGAYFDSTLINRVKTAIQAKELDPVDYLERNDAWHFFEKIDALFSPGATGTNVCDLRIVLK
ncbi:MAG: DUF4147 domain-containing protein [Planctomycetia bacterium]|nr:DUF4147 domain-containing protein [Planctomycetia bacterium]